MRSEISTARWVVRLLHLAALACFLVGLFAWLHPQTPPYRGRFAWAPELAFWLFGPLGPALMWAAAGATCSMLARALWRHTPKLPTDRWL